MADVTVSPEAVIACAREHVANYKVPHGVEVVDALPRNASGEVLNTVLRERVAHATTA
jgi:acyl-CoA synthetase (AMP-forming)/AMP-acid ligase II